MIGEKALGEKLAARMDQYATSWRESSQAAQGNDKTVRLTVAIVLGEIAKVIRDVTQ